MGKISKSDQPAHLDTAEQERLDEISARLADPRRGHHAEGSSWNMRLGHGYNIKFRVHWLNDKWYLIQDDLYKEIAPLR